MREANLQRAKVVEIVQRVLTQVDLAGGEKIIQFSLENLERLKGSSDRNDQIIASIFEDTLKAMVGESSETYIGGKKRIAHLLENAGILDPPQPKKLTFLEKYHLLFWDPNGGPKPRQIIAEWTSFAIAMSSIAVGYNLFNQEPDAISQNTLQNCTCDTQSITPGIAIGGGIAYIAANILGTFAVIYFAGPM